MNNTNIEETKHARADVINPPSLRQICESMGLSRRHNPRALELVIQGKELLEVDTELTVQIVPTSLRTVFVADYEHPEFEIEGWLISFNQQKVWVCGSLRTNDSDEIVEATIYKMAPGEESGTDRTPRIH